MEKAEIAFNALLTAAARRVELSVRQSVSQVLYYAAVKLDLTLEGVSVRDRRLRQACKKREGASYKIYFKSDLFWGE